jgi:hypothetical protein
MIMGISRQTFGRIIGADLLENAAADYVPKLFLWRKS